MSPDTRPRIRGKNNCKECAENKERSGIAELRYKIRKQREIKNDSRKRNTYFHIRRENLSIPLSLKKTKMAKGVR